MTFLKKWWIHLLVAMVVLGVGGFFAYKMYKKYMQQVESDAEAQAGFDQSEPESERELPPTPKPKEVERKPAQLDWNNPEEVENFDPETVDVGGDLELPDLDGMEDLLDKGLDVEQLKKEGRIHFPTKEEHREQTPTAHANPPKGQIKPLKPTPAQPTPAQPQPKQPKTPQKGKQGRTASKDEHDAFYVAKAVNTVEGWKHFLDTKYSTNVMRGVAMNAYKKAQKAQNSVANA